MPPIFMEVKFFLPSKRRGLSISTDVEISLHFDRRLSGGESVGRNYR